MGSMHECNLPFVLFVFICYIISVYMCITCLLFVCQVLDYLTIGVHELASMSERRMERLVNPGNLTFVNFRCDRVTSLARTVFYLVSRLG